MRPLLLGLVLSTLIVSPALACGPASKTQSNLPPLAASLDAMLPKAKLTAADAAKVGALRVKMTKLASTGKQDEARDAEEEAMRILGYEKAYMRCGPGTFSWRKVNS